MTPGRRKPLRIREEGTRAEGQSTVEFALIVPIVVLVVLLVVQVGVIVYANIAAAHLSREVARTLAVDPHADVGHLAAHVSTLRGDRLTIEVVESVSEDTGRAMVSVAVTYDIPPIIRPFDLVLRNVSAHAETRMLAEIK